MSDLRVPDLNHVLIAGRLTREPELKYTGDGRPYCRFSIANTRYYKDRNGQRTEDTTFVDVTSWGPMAEFIGEKLRKGRPVLVEGSLRTNEWEDQATGQRRSRLILNGRRVTPLDWEDSGSGGNRVATRAESGPDLPVEPREIEEPIPEDDIPF